MKKIITLLAAIIFASCSSDSVNENVYTPPATEDPVSIDKNYQNLVFLDATYQRLNSNGVNLPVSVGDPVTIFERTTFVRINSLGFETNNIQLSTYFLNGITYSLPNSTQFVIYENDRIIFKNIQYPTSYGSDKRTERYSY